MPDVARAAGVSLKTVSRVVNGEPNVTPATTARVNEAIEALGFERNDIARGLRAGQTSASIGLVIEDLSNPFYSAVARAVEEVADAHGFMLVAGSSEEDGERERRLVRALLQRRVDGLLVVPTGADHRYLAAEAARTPTVFVDRPPRGVRADAVLLDNAGGARQAAEHLARRRHRRIAVVGGPAGLSTMDERVRGFRDGLDACGVALDDALVRLDGADPASAASAMSDLLDRKRPPTAVFCLNNRATMGVVRAIVAAGAGGKAPEVVGFDDFEAADLLPVPVAVVAYDEAELGRRAAEALLARIDGHGGRARRVIVPTRLRLPVR